MRAALIVYGSLESLSGGYLYDRMLVSAMRLHGDDVHVITQPRRSYAANLLDNLGGRLPAVDVLIQDELNHPSLFLANRRLPHPPIVSVIHHLRSSEHRPSMQNLAYAAVERAYLRGVDGFIFNSETTRESVRLLLRAEKPHVVATPGGDRLGRSTAESVRRRVARGGPLRLVSVGNVTREKGVEILVQSIEQVRSETLHLDIIGPEAASPAFAVRMRRKSEALDLPITFHGPLSDTDLRAHLETADAFVLPSYYEGFGIAYLEAMAHGLPAIGISAGAVPGLIQHGSNGFLVPSGNVIELANAVRALARDRALLLRMSLEALRRAGTFPTWDQSTAKAREFLLAMAGLH